MVVQSKHSVVVAAKMTRSHLRKQFGKLTKNTFESVPLWWVKGPGVLAADLDERSCKPEFREQIVDLVRELLHLLEVVAHQSWSKTSPSGQTKVRLKATGGAGSISIK